MTNNKQMSDAIDSRNAEIQKLKRERDDMAYCAKAAHAHVEELISKNCNLRVQVSDLSFILAVGAVCFVAVIIFCISAAYYFL